MSAQTAEGAHTPAYWAPRRALFEDLYAKQLESFKAKRKPILVQAVKRLTALDGADEVQDVTCTGFFTKPIDLLPLASAPAASLDALKADLATHSESTPTQRIPSTVGSKVVVVARVNGTKLWDLTRPLEEPVDLLEFIYWSDAAPEKDETPADDSNDIDELDEETQNLARHVFWHSSAHMLGYAMEKALEPCKLHHGPALDAIFSKKAGETSAAPSDADLNKLSGYPKAVQLHKMCSQYTKSDKLVTGGGFFYEASVASAIKESTEFKKLEKQIGTIQRENHQFQRLVLTKPEAIALFNDNPLKQKWIEKSTETEGDACVLTAYRCGDFIDLCRGPHVISTGVVRKVVLTKVGGVHSASAEECLQLEGHKMCLQRVYGISFPTNALAKVYTEYFERASTQLDHKTVGIGHTLFNTSVDMACPGSAFFFPHGTRIYNALMTFMRKEYTKRGYEEVITANIYDKKLWKTSGHWDKYRENLFLIASDSASNPQGTAAADASGDNTDSSMAIKPMNCPGHCVLFGLKAHSYKSLPLRYAEFGVLHRNEVRGALRGLTRVTRFVQDDAHIFCTPYQLHAEIGKNLDFLGFVYEGVLGFTDYKLMLSTKPANKLYIGEDAIWELAESKLQSALNAFCFARVAQAIRTLLPDSECTEHDGWWPLVDGSSGEAAAASPVAQFWAAYGFQTFAYDGSPLSIARVHAFRKEIREELKQAKVRGPASTSPLKNFVADLINHEGAHALMVSVFETKLWVLNEGEGAFYGPKIDVEVCDSMGRSHQLGTTQLDFNLPQRFDLKYAEKTSNAAAQSEVTRPIMIHRAILGSIERCIGILTEHYEGGKRWPLWLSPRQIMIVPISKYQFDYAARLRKVFESPEVYGEAGSILQGGDVDLAASVNACTLDEGQFADVPGFYCDADLSENKLDKKIRNAQQAYYNFIFVVGREEAESGCVNVRARDNTQLGIHKVEEVLKMMHKLRKQYWRHDTVPGWGA